VKAALDFGPPSFLTDNEFAEQNLPKCRKTLSFRRLQKNLSSLAKAALSCPHPAQ
jgi:hypothetical protein